MPPGIVPDAGAASRELRERGDYSTREYRVMLKGSDGKAREKGGEKSPPNPYWTLAMAIFKEEVANVAATAGAAKLPPEVVLMV